jgi:hypothetical protein
MITTTPRGSRIAGLGLRHGNRLARFAPESGG